MEHSDYIKNTVMPQFGAWCKGFIEQLPEDDVMSNARLFLKNHVDVTMLKNRGEVYEAFEDLKTFAKLAKVINASSPQDALYYDNMETLAQGIVWCVEHDGFDLVKYDDFTSWGKDIVGVM